MTMADMTFGPLPFVQQWHEHSAKVGEALELIQPLVDTLLAQDHEKIGTLRGQMSRITSDADRIKLALYDQIKDMHFRSAGSYAFNRYLGSQDKMADAAQDFADLLMLRKTTIPTELRTGFQALVAQVVKIGRQVVNLAKGLSSPVEAAATDRQAQDAREAIASIVEGNHQAGKLEMELAQRVYGLERQLDPVTILLLDKYRAVLREMAEAAECAAEHLRLVIG